LNYFKSWGGFLDFLDSYPKRWIIPYTTATIDLPELLYFYVWDPLTCVEWVISIWKSTNAQPLYSLRLMPSWLHQVEFYFLWDSCLHLNWTNNSVGRMFLFSKSLLKFFIYYYYEHYLFVCSFQKLLISTAREIFQWVHLRMRIELVMSSQA
jgi:hypothetical protein